MDELIKSAYDLHTDDTAKPRITPAEGAAAGSEQIAATSFPRLAGLLRNVFPACGFRFSGLAEYNGGKRRGLSMTVLVYDRQSGSRKAEVELVADPIVRPETELDPGGRLGQWLMTTGLDEVTDFFSFQP